MSERRYPEKNVIESTGENVVPLLELPEKVTSRRISLTISTVGPAKITVDGDTLTTKREMNVGLYEVTLTRSCNTFARPFREIIIPAGVRFKLTYSEGG